MQIVEETQGVEKAQQLASDYTNKALKDIQKLPNHPEGIKETLLQITKLILHREN